MNRTRRTFLLGTATVAGLGALAYAARFPFRAASSEPQPLRIPALLDARKEGHAISLKVQAGRTAFFEGRESATLGYNGGYLGPTILLYHRHLDGAVRDQPRCPAVPLTCMVMLDSYTASRKNPLTPPGCGRRKPATSRASLRVRGRGARYTRAAPSRSAAGASPTIVKQAPRNRTG